MSKSISEQADVLSQLFNKVIEKKYGSKRSPSPLIMSTGIGHLDALLGGGILSSGPVMITSTPESGKSTLAYQFAGTFHNAYENGVIVYIDIEGSGGSQETTQYKISRAETFGLDKSTRFRYEPIVLNLKELFNLLSTLVEQKKIVEEKTGREFYVFLIWDSVAATRSSKTDEVDDHNQLIGFKARELSFYLEQSLPYLKFHRIFFLCIDQVRAKIKIDGPFAQQEKTVGQFKNMQAASNTFSLLHNIQQWLFLSRGKAISPTDNMGIEGWYLNIWTEKNKLAPSQHGISCVFDMHTGLSKFWSEFTFLSDKTPTEKKIYREKKLPSPLMLEKASAQKYHLKVPDSETDKIQYTSDTFFKKDAKQKYLNDKEFKKWFDYAVELSAYQRITHGMFKEDITAIDEENDVEMHSEMEQLIDTSAEQNIKENIEAPAEELSEEKIEENITQTTEDPDPDDDYDSAF
jgi:RecA/RadA recombinase